MIRPQVAALACCAAALLAWGGGVGVGGLLGERGGPTSAGPADPAHKPAPSRSVYHTDPKHLWNRLYEALFVRVGPDGRTYGQDRLEPLLWRQSKHLLEERSNKRAVAHLEEFL